VLAVKRRKSGRDRLTEFKLVAERNMRHFFKDRRSNSLNKEIWQIFDLYGVKTPEDVVW